MELVRSLEDLDQSSVTLAGAKAAHLGDLLGSGFPVPPGFVLLTAAYQTFLATNGLQSQIEHLIGQIRPDELSSAVEASATVRIFIEGATMPDDISTAVVDAYAQLGETPVAVRSCAISEDRPEASSAGQQETFLNVKGTDQLLVAVKRCWSSLWTARAIVYRARLGVSPETAEMAVIVQRMVPADSSGVLFTTNPVTGAGDEVVIDAAWGLGEAVVGGQVTPDHVVVDKATGQVKGLQPGDKAVMTALAAEGTTQIPVDPEKRRQLVLTTDQIAELTRLGREIEARLSHPQDIEWAIAGGRVHILQSRPVTTLPSLAQASHQPAGPPVPPGDDSWDREDEMPPRPFDLWTRTNFGENLPYPITPLTATTFPAIFGLDTPPVEGKDPEPQIARRFYGRLYVNEGAIMHRLSEDYGLPGAIVDRMWGSRRRGQHRSNAKFRPLRLICRLPSLARQGVAQMRNPDSKQANEQFFTQIDAWVDDFSRRDRRGLDDSAFWAEGLPVWRPRGKRVWNKNMGIATSAAMTFAVLERLVDWWTGQKEITHDLVTGLTGVYSAEIGPALWQMTEALRDAGLADIVLDDSPERALAHLQTEASAWHFTELLEDFLRRHGHRCPNEVELLYPRWVDASEQVVALIAGYLRAGEGLDPRQAEERQRQRREAAVSVVERRLGRLRRAIFRSVLARTQKAVRGRDNSRHYVTKFFYPMRRICADLGQRWVDRAWLGHPDDIFFLTRREVEAIVEAGRPTAVAPDIRTLVENRRAAHSYWYHVVPPEVIGPDGVPVEEADDEGEVLYGVPASGGQARGIARLVRDPREATRLRLGDILVTQATDPGWTQVFPLVSGLVLEIGGQLSHGAIVAREYGIPAVVNVQGAQRRIKDGQTITVDGTAGRVYLS